MTLGAVFARVLAMSLTGALAILIVCLVRPLLRRAPAWLACLLWGVVLVRLLCPVGLPLLPAAGELHIHPGSGRASGGVRL